MMRFGPIRWGLQAAECFLLSVAIGCAAYFAFIMFNASTAIRVSGRFGIHQDVQGIQPDSTRASFASDSEATALTAAAVIGRLEIPELALSTPIFSDYEVDSLLKGVGHIPGTAMPGGLGTLGLAGHRDTYFRPLRYIKKGMTIRVANRDGTYHYVVDTIQVVKPENVEVLDIGSQPRLTLITCYPFQYVGAAPFRFIVNAHLLSVSPD